MYRALHLPNLLYSKCRVNIPVLWIVWECMNPTFLSIKLEVLFLVAVTHLFSATYRGYNRTKN